MLFVINNNFIQIKRNDFINDHEYYIRLMNFLKPNYTIKKLTSAENINNIINCKI